MSGSTRNPVTAAQATELVADPWRVIGDYLKASFATKDMVRGGEFVARIIDAAESAGHHPDIDLRYGAVHLSLITHSAKQLTEADVALANTIVGIAHELEISTADAPPTAVEIAIDALDIAAIRPFWKAVLGYTDGPDTRLDELADPSGKLPEVWFQQMDAPRPQRSRTHIDVEVPHDVLQTRLQAALDAGGRLLTDEYAPAFWVLADAEGNEACLCTWQGRDND